MGIELPQIGRYFLVLTHNLGTSFLYFGRFLVALFLNLGAYLSKAFVSNLRNVSGWVSLSSSFPNIMLFSITWALTLLILRFPPLWKSLLDSNKAIAIPAIIFKAVSFPLQCSNFWFVIWNIHIQFWKEVHNLGSLEIKRIVRPIPIILIIVI